MLRTYSNIHNKWMNTIGFFVVGLIMALAQAPFNFSFLYFLILPLLGLYLRDLKDKKTGFSIGWWTGLGYFGFTIIWIIEPFFVEPKITGWIAPFALVFMAGGLALFWALAFYIATWLTSTGKIRLIFLAITWTFFEYLRSYIFTGFPWGHLSYGLLSLPIIQLVSWIGAHGLGLLLLIICFLPAICAPQVKSGLTIMLSLLCLLTVIGLWRSNNINPDNSKNIIIRVVQPNATQNLKWRADKKEKFYRKLLDLTNEKSSTSPNVVIWPETSISKLLNDSDAVIKEISIAAGPNTSVVAGIVRKEKNNSRNSLILINEDGAISAIFDKQHLVPFGEYMPMGNFLNTIGLSSLTGLAGNFKPGKGSRIIDGGSIPNFLALICYEAIFSNYSNNIEDRPDWIVQITNDAWFGRFSGPYQHLAQARIRAIEQGVPFVRSANTGISAMIDPYGRILNSIELETSGYFDAVLPAKLPPTPYAKFGELFLSIISCLLLLASLKNIYRKTL